MKKLFSILFALLVISTAQAQTPPLPSVPATPAFKCLGDWYLSITDTRLILPKKGQDSTMWYVSDSYLRVTMTSSAANQDGSVSCSGFVEGFANSSANMFHNPNDGYTDLSISMPPPMAPISIQASSRLFVDSQSQRVSGGLSGTVQDSLSGQAYSTLIQAKVVLSRKG